MCRYDAVQTNQMCSDLWPSPDTIGKHILQVRCDLTVRISLRANLDQRWRILFPGVSYRFLLMKGGLDTALWFRIFGKLPTNLNIEHLLNPKLNQLNIY
jgi:hypothetical protein